MNKNDIIYISVNNWFGGRDFPPTKNFRKWLTDDLNQKLCDDEWAKENKLCIYHGVIDMSQNYTISAPRKWVEENCPELLTDKEYTYTTRISDYSSGSLKWKDEKCTKKYSDFVYTPKDGEDAPDEDSFGMPFREYCEENFGSEYYETNYWDDDDDWDDDDESEDENEKQ